MSETEFTTIGVQPEYRTLINQVADYHGLKTYELFAMLISAYAFMTPEGRESVLDIGAHIVRYASSGMRLEFNDSLDVSEACAKDILYVDKQE